MSAYEKPFTPPMEDIKLAQATEGSISSMLGLLPASLQLRMGPFGHFRRSASMGNIRTTKDLSITQSPARSRPVSSSGTSLLVREDEDFGDIRDDGSQSETSTLAVLPRTPPTRDAETSSSAGINWRFAHQGSGLISIASDAHSYEDNDVLERKAYLDGLTYLLRSLPSNLSTYEVDQIQAALPHRLAAREVDYLKSGTTTPTARQDMPKSAVHRLVQSVVLNIFLVVHFIMPYIVVILKSMASVERKYKVSEAVVGHGMNCFNAAGRQCARIAEVVLTVNDGKMGREVSSTFAWTIEEVTRGVSDGLGEGFHVTRFRDAS